MDNPVSVHYLSCKSCKGEVKYSLHTPTTDPQFCGAAKGMRGKCKNDIPCFFTWVSKEEVLSEVDELLFGLRGDK